MPLLQCPNCGTVVRREWTECRRCLTNLSTHPPKESGNEEGVGAPGLVAWLAAVIGNLTVLVLCVLPAVLLVLGILILLIVGLAGGCTDPTSTDPGAGTGTG